MSTMEPVFRVGTLLLTYCQRVCKHLFGVSVDTWFAGDQWSPVDGDPEGTADMFKMFKRLVVIAAGVLVAASLGMPSASAQGVDYGSFTLTVNKTAPYVDYSKTAITVSGTYKCTAEGFTPSPQWSGINVNVQQVQRGRVIVTGEGFVNLTDPICTSVSQDWSVVVPAMMSGPNGPTNAVWKGGKVAVEANGHTSAGQCDMNQPCAGINAQVSQVVHVR
jgi:hypothetical protein